MIKNKTVLIAGCLTIVVALSFGFYPLSEKSPAVAKVVQKQTSNAISAQDKPVDPSPIKLIDNSVANLTESEPIESEDTGVENTEPVVLADNMTSDQQAIDFKMMNPEVPNSDATEGAVEYEVVSVAVDWDSARDHEMLPTELLTEEQFNVAKKSVVPVLLPPRQPLLDQSVISIGDTWYAASMDEGDVNVLIEGSSASVVLPNETESNYGTLNTYEIVRSFGMVEVRVTAFNVGYTITVECFDHESDPACIYDDYISEIVSNLLLVNGEKKDEGA